MQRPLGRLQRPHGYSASGARNHPRCLYDDRAVSERVTGRQPLEAARGGVEDGIFLVEVV